MMSVDDVKMYYDQAMSFLGQGEIEKSLVFFDKALKTDENYSPAWNNKGIALLSLEKYFEALDCFEHVMALNPMDSMVIYNKGYVLLMLERYQESVDTLELFLKRYSQKDDFYKFGLYLQAKGFYNLKNYEYAELLLQKAVKKDKNFKEAQELRGIVLKEKNSAD